MFGVVRHRRWLLLLTFFAMVVPAYADNVTVSGSVSFSSLDGSSLDHDGVANGTFTVDDGDLAVLGIINCNDDGAGNNSACAMRFAVSGNLTVHPGGAIQAENRRGSGTGGNITFDVGGNVVLLGAFGAQAGAIVSSGNEGNDEAGDIDFNVTGSVLTEAGSVVTAHSKGGAAGAINMISGGAADIRGMIASGPSATVASTMYTGAVLTGGSSNTAGGAITIRSTSHVEPSVSTASTAVVVSQGTFAGAAAVVLEGCGIEVNGLVASVSRAGVGAKVTIHSGTSAIIDGRDLGASGPRLGMVRADALNQGAGTYSANVFAPDAIAIHGPAAGALYAVNSSGGKTSSDANGTINIISTGGIVTASGNAFAATGTNAGDQGGAINVSAMGSVSLDGAHLNAAGDFATNNNNRRGGALSVRSHSAGVTWLNGSGDVRPTGSASGLSPAQQGTITITYCTTVATTGSSYPTDGAPTGPFPTMVQSCSPASPSLPPGESHPDCNDPPVAVNDAYTVAEGGTLTEPPPGVLGNDVDPDGDPITAILVSGPANASSFTLNSDGSFTYIHDGSETASDSFTYKANDGSMDSNVATVNIVITPVNDPPVANADSYTLAEGGTLNVAAPGVKANDTDPDGPAGVVTLVSGPSHGSSFTLNADGSFTYVHDGSETTADSFTYNLSDGQYDSTATVSLTITAVNDAPVANNDSYSVNEGGTLNVAAPGVKANDTDPDGPSSTVILVSGPANAASFSLNADGSFSYVHNGGETTSDSFTYKINDGLVDSNVATVSITIDAVNDAPVANDDSYSVDEGGTLNVAPPGVRANDTDPDGPSQTAVLVSGPAHASSFVLNADGSFTYVHDGSETTSDSFTYKLNDGLADSNVATVSITVNAVNDAPVANDDGYSVDEGGTLNVPAPGVLGNDTDAEGSALNVVLVSGPANASSFTLNADGSFTYVHNGGETTSDTFTYKANDGSLDSNVATVTITINAVNDAPVANGDTYTVAEGGTLNVPSPGVLGNDTDADNVTLTAVLVSGPAHASSFTLNANGSFTYIHNGSETLSDSFTYKANDGSADSNVVTVSITITAVNDAPVANDDGYNVDEGGTLNVAAPGVLGNDTDAENDALNAVLVSGPANASSFALNADGSFTYVHNGGETTTDSFTYRANDGSLNSNVATVTITINAVNDAPVANNDAYSVDEGGTLSVAAPGVLANDTDSDNVSLNAVLVTGPANASSFSLNADGSFTYVHNGSETTSDTFTYKANDGSADSNVATVLITINAVNDAPVANNDNYSVNEGGTLAIPAPGVIGNDTDAENNALTATLVTGPANATSFTLNPDGSFTYVHNGSETTSDGFTYRVSDGTSLSNIATVAITINAVNDAPVANNDSYSVSFHQTLNVSAPGVLGNDTDADSPTLNAVLVSGPTHGSLSLNADGSFTYQHTGATLGTDSFTYQASDGTDLSNIATVTISIINQAPVATGDSFSAVGNTELRVGTGATVTPAAVVSGSVLANDTDSDGPSPLVVSASDPMSANGGTVSMNANGTFNYLPAVAFVGTDTFNYTVSDGQASASATVTILVSDRVWYVNIAAAGSQTGRSSEPFATLSQAQSASFINDYIHVAQGTYATGITLKDGQRLVGSGVPLVVGSYTLAPATARPALNGTITLASGNTVTGLNVFITGLNVGISANAVTGGTIDQVTSSGGFQSLGFLNANGTWTVTDVTLLPDKMGMSIVGGNPTVNASNLDITTTVGKGIVGSAGTLNISAGADGSTVASAGGVPIDLSNMALNVSLRSVTAAGGDTGISLDNTTGTFTVTGDNSNNANGSGGSISNVTVRPVHLLGANGTVSLKSMNMSLSSSAVSGVMVDNNAGGTLTVNLAGTSITGANATAQNKALLQFEGAGTANITANVQGSFFNNSRTYGLFSIAMNTSVMNVTVNQSGFGTDVVTTGAVNNPGTVITLPNVIGLAVTNGGSAQVDYSITNNTFWGANGSAGAIYAVTISSAATGAGSHLTGSFMGNKIGQTGVVGSGCSGACSGLGLLPGQNGTFSATVTNNDVRHVGARGIEYANTVSGAVGSNVIKIKGNTLAEPDTGGSFRRAISVTTGNSGGAASNVCAEIGGAATGDKNSVSGTWQAGQFVRLTTLNTTGTLTLPGLSPAAGATAAQINAFVDGNNVGVTGSVSTTIGGAIVGGSPCP